MRDYITTLRHSEEQRLAEPLKQAVLSYPGLGEYLGMVWDEVRARVRDDAARETDSRIRANVKHLGVAQRGCVPTHRSRPATARMRAVLTDLCAHATQRSGGLDLARCGAGIRALYPDKVERAIA